MLAGGGDSGIGWVEWVMAWKVVHDLSAKGRRQWQQQVVRSLSAIRTSRNQTHAPRIPLTEPCQQPAKQLPHVTAAADGIK